MAQQSIPEKAEKSARHLASEAADVAKQVETGVKEQLDGLERIIRRNPVASVTAAAGLGLVLALLARR